MTDDITCGFCRHHIGTIITEDEETLRSEVIRHLKVCRDNPHAGSEAIVETYAFLLTEAYRRVAEMKRQRATVAE